jgi:hypothetical protein
MLLAVGMDCQQWFDCLQNEPVDERLKLLVEELLICQAVELTRADGVLQMLPL